MSKTMKKEDAHRIVDHMPRDATWDDLIHKIYVREAIERSMADSKEGRVRNVKDVRAKYGLPE